MPEMMDYLQAARDMLEPPVREGDALAAVAAAAIAIVERLDKMLAGQAALSMVTCGECKWAAPQGVPGGLRFCRNPESPMTIDLLTLGCILGERKGG